MTSPATSWCTLPSDWCLPWGWPSRWYSLLSLFNVLWRFFLPSTHRLPHEKKPHPTRSQASRYYRGVDYRNNCLQVPSGTARTKQTIKLDKWRNSEFYEWFLFLSLTCKLLVIRFLFHCLCVPQQYYTAHRYLTPLSIARNLLDFFFTHSESMWSLFDL